MELKPYQQQAIDDLSLFLEQAQTSRDVSAAKHLLIAMLENIMLKNCLLKTVLRCKQTDIKYFSHDDFFVILKTT